jgi:transposase
MTLLLAELRRMLFGQKSEKLQRQVDMLEFELEALRVNQGAHTGAVEQPAAQAAPTPVRRPLPLHLPRQVVEHPSQVPACPDCGQWKRLVEDVRDVLEYVPASFKVIQHLRPRFTCVCCDRMMQPPAPSRPIAGGLAGPRLLGHFIVSTYADHTTLHRRSAIYSREGVELSEGTMADWVGASHQLLSPLVDALRDHVFARKLHSDDTPVPVLMPGTGKTRQARL